MQRNGWLLHILHLLITAINAIKYVSQTQTSLGTFTLYPYQISSMKCMAA